jgi:hypothetical protein
MLIFTIPTYYLLIPFGNPVSRPFTIIITIEGLGTNCVGCYGNSLCPTPHFDQLASKSIVLDQLWSDSSEPLETLTSWWTSSHRISRSGGHHVYSPWIELLQDSLLVTDNPLIFEGPDELPFAKAILAEGQSRENATHFELLLEAALATWNDHPHEYPMLWIHSRGLHGSWDAPYELRKIMCDEGDPDPPHGVEPMELVMHAKTDPDDVFKISCAVGGQVISMDQAFGDFRAALSQMQLPQNCVVMVCGISGYPLGEHGRVGGSVKPLRVESLQLPCMVFLGDALPLGARLPNILQPHELGDWLMPWLQRNEDSDSEEILQGMLEESFDTIDRVGAAIAIHEKETYLAVPAWGCRFSLNPEGESVVELYAKPDDRWEQNEVSSRAISIVDKLVVLRDRLRDAYLVSSTLEGPINWTDESLICPPR